VFIFRDTIVDAYRMSVASLGVDVSANWWGKAKTITQMIGIIVIFFCIDSINQSKWEYWVLQNGFLIISVFLSIVSGIIYIFSFSSRSRNFLK
jgi:CDP-diacylglycerol--glycerol-3-phosphate 3-phosphatidyltransferase